MGYASKWLEMYFYLFSMGFKTFQQSWKMFLHSVCLSVHPFLHALILLNMLQMYWNLFMLFISDIEWSVLKMLCIRLKIRLQRQTKVFWYITAYGRGGFLKCITTYFCYTKCNKNNTCHWDVQKCVTYEKLFI